MRTSEIRNWVEDLTNLVDWAVELAKKKAGTINDLRRKLRDLQASVFISQAKPGTADRGTNTEDDSPLADALSWRVVGVGTEEWLSTGPAPIYNTSTGVSRNKGSGDQAQVGADLHGQWVLLDGCQGVSSPFL